MAWIKLGCIIYILLVSKVSEFIEFLDCLVSINVKRLLSLNMLTILCNFSRLLLINNIQQFPNYYENSSRLVEYNYIVSKKINTKNFKV